MDRQRLKWLLVALAVVAVTALVTYFVVLGEPSLMEPGPRSAAHEGIDCLRCHDSYSGVEDRLCLECHGDMVGLDWHTGAGGGEDCSRCHYEHVGSDYITDLGQVPPHPDRSRPLSGVHTPLRCVECHWTDGVEGDCSYCHQRYIGGTHEVGFTSECDLCHIQSTWEVDYDHAHETAECVDCHGDDPDHAYPGYLEYEPDCEGCHGVEMWLLPEFDHEAIGEPCELCHPSSLDPDHAGSSGSCAHCHGVERWTPQHVDHARLEPPCARCHEGDRPAEHLSDRELGRLDCDSCHAPGVDWARAYPHNDPELPCQQCHGTPWELHDEAYSDDCQWCHFTDARHLLASHPAQTAWCLDCHVAEHLGGDPARSVDAEHATRCAACHLAGTAWDEVDVDHEPLGKDCYSCHEAVHGAIGAWEVSCGVCHDTEHWVPVSVDHDLLGGDCLSCHPTTHPNGRDRFSEDCTLCHDTEDWADVAWDHELLDQYIIACVNCHDDIHRGTLGIVCEDCHTTDTWETEVINP